MDSLFGIPMGVLMVICLVIFACALTVTVGLALRNRIFLKLALRNISRRRGRAALIVVGLMLGTLIISAALSTGDTMSHTIRSSVLIGLGNIDEVISREGVDLDVSSPDMSGDDIYFDEALVIPIEEIVANSSLVDGIAPVIIETVAVQNRTSRQNEPRVTLFAIDSARVAGFGEPKEIAGGDLSFAALGPDEVYLNGKAADELNASAGDELLIFVDDKLTTLRAAALVNYPGAGTDGPAILMALSAAQTLLNREGQIKHIAISNRGGSLSGVDNTEEVIAHLDPVVSPLGLEVDATKERAIDFVNTLGSSFTSFFVTFGMFSIAAGIMLIALIFVMLAAERRSEMGMARAVGTKRFHLTQMFLFEGTAYSLLSSVVGAILGLAVAYGMVFLMAKAFATFGVDIKHDFRPRSLIVAYTLGMILTFVVVTVSAWRVSALNIVTAMRDLPDPMMRRGSILSVIGGALAFVVGCPLIIFGLNAKLATPFYLGVSFLIIGLLPVLRRLRLPDRMVYTVVGVALLVWWLLPFDTLSRFLPEFSSDISIFIVSGIMIVIGGSWTVMYNSDLILRAIMGVFGRLRWLTPVLKTAIAYPLTNRFRTGMTVAMFSLVVFTLVVMATLTNSFSDLLNDEEAFSGGFDIRSTTIQISSVNDMETAILEASELNSDDFEVIASQSSQGLMVRQVDTVLESATYRLVGADDAFLRENKYEFATIAEGFNSGEEVWQALRERPGLAIVDYLPVPTRNNFGFEDGGLEFELEGFFIEDESFSPIDVEVMDPQTDEVATLTIIGVLKETSPTFMIGITTSTETITSAFGPEVATTYFFRLQDGINADNTADSLESTFLLNGMEADALAEELADEVGPQLTFNYILQGFMGIGLLVGVAALGVISARSVVERRQQIGVLRAIGYKRAMVQLSFLLESSFVAILGIGLGSVLGLILSFNIISDISRNGSGANISFAVPWLNLGVIFLIAYGSSLLATLLPSRVASRFYPSEALRYE